MCFLPDKVTIIAKNENPPFSEGFQIYIVICYWVVVPLTQLSVLSVAAAA